MTTKSVKDPSASMAGAAWATLLAMGAVAASTVVAFLVLGREDTANVAILYLFTIAAVSVQLGYRPSIVAAIASALCFDYDFLQPYHSFAITHGRQLITFGGMFATAIFISTLNERLRKQARAARLSERRTEHLYALVKTLADAESVDALCTSAARQVEIATNASACILLRRGEEGFYRAFRAGGAAAVETEDLEAAGWAAAHLEAAGLGTRNFPTTTATYLPLIAARGCVGVLSLRPPEGSARFSSLTVSMARQVAISIERVLLADEKRAALLDAETERIRSAVLSSVSHDLRAPLAVIASGASTLLEHGERLSRPGRAEMARIIHDESRRLNELLKSLLDVTRLQSGALHVNRDWESLEEVIGGVLRRIDEHADGRRLVTTIPSDVPLLRFDAILIEQVLLNLVDNALKHSRSDQMIELDVCARGVDDVLISLVDHGAGIHPTELTRIFEKFYRSGAAVGAGLGLGLAIARGIVQAHGGRIWATQTSGGGLTVQFTLPLSISAPGPALGVEPLEEAAS